MGALSTNILFLLGMVAKEHTGKAEGGEAGGISL